MTAIRQVCVVSRCSLRSLVSSGRLDFVNNKDILESFKQRDHVMEYCIWGEQALVAM